MIRRVFTLAGESYLRSHCKRRLLTGSTLGRQNNNHFLHPITLYLFVFCKTSQLVGTANLIRAMPEITSALLVREHWANLILDKRKSWELRGSRTRKRGTIFIAISLKSLLPLPLSCFLSLHQVSDWDSVKYREIFAWVLTHPVRFESPKPYTHPQGAIGWVDLAKPKNQQTKNSVLKKSRSKKSQK